MVAFSKVIVAAWEASSTAVVAGAFSTAGSELTSTWPAVVTCIAIVGWVDTKVPAVGIKVVVFPSYSVVRCPSLLAVSTDFDPSAVSITRVQDFSIREPSVVSIRVIVSIEGRQAIRHPDIMVTGQSAANLQ